MNKIVKEYSAELMERFNRFIATNEEDFWLKYMFEDMNPRSQINLMKNHFWLLKFAEGKIERKDLWKKLRDTEYMNAVEDIENMKIEYCLSKIDSFADLFEVEVEDLEETE